MSALVGELREWGHPLAMQAADEIDRLTSCISDVTKERDELRRTNAELGVATVEAMGERDEWKRHFEVANAKDHEAIEADRVVSRALGREEMRAYAELLRFAASEALIAIESDPDIEQGWPNTVALLREALAKNREGTREAALQALTDFHQEHAPSGQWVPETGQYGARCARVLARVRTDVNACGEVQSDTMDAIDELLPTAGTLHQSGTKPFRKEGDRIVIEPGALPPHLAAIVTGTIAGDFRDWPKVRSEVLDFIGTHLCGTSRHQVSKEAEELKNIAFAKRHDPAYFSDDTEFADWAQSRARATLGGLEFVACTHDWVAWTDGLGGTGKRCSRCHSGNHQER